MKKLIVGLSILGLFLLNSLTTEALTRPSPDADMESLSYVFYLYYDNGQLFADRDVEIKFDVLNQKYVPIESPLPGNYKGEINTFKSTIAQTFSFDPRAGDVNFTKGKVQIKGPYVPDARQVTFYNAAGSPILNVFVNSASLCNDDGVCTAVEGENIKTCVNDCKQPRETPSSILPSVEEGFDLNTILIYSVGGLAVLMGAWFGWKWWKKKRGESFLPPPAAPPIG